MAAGWPTKANYATGDVLSATNMNDLSGTVNLINPTAKGDLYAGSAANTYTKLAVGANNTVLTADSTTATGLKWAAASGSSGSLTKISTTPFSNVASQDIDSVFSSTYNSYLVVISNVYAATGSDDLHLQMRVGSTTSATLYYGAMDAVSYLGVSTITGVNSGTECLLSSNIGTSAIGTSAFFYVNFPGGGGSSCRPAILGESFDSSGAAFNNFGYERSSAAVYTGFRLKSSSSNITGTVVVYGLEK